MPEIARRKKIARSFGVASKSYDVSARLQRNSGKNLLPWLPQTREKIVVDLGCGTGFFTDLLAGHYQKVIGVDISKLMLNYCQQKCSNNVDLIMADANHLPLQDESVDIIFSNLVLQWCEPLDKAISESLRILKPGGTFVFTTLLEGTLIELKESWAEVDNDKHVNDFLTEQCLQNVLNNANCTEFETQVRDIVLEYENVVHLAHELKGLGANHVSKKKNKGLAGKEKWNKMCSAYEVFKDNSGIYPATYKLCSIHITK